MISKAFFRRFETYLKENGVEIQYKHNDKELEAEDYEKMFDLIYLFALSTSIVSEKDVDLGSWARMNYTTINPMMLTEKKINEITTLKNSLIPMKESDIVDSILDKSIFKILE